MLSKVTNRAKRRAAAQQKSTCQALRVDIAPELLRWSDFSTPFPSVSLGGYSRFYSTHTTPESTESLNFCPLLSQYPEPSSKIPQKSPLFATLRRRDLPVIREVSLESLTPNKPRNLTISTTPPHSLKRQRRRIFRTPSTERDFVDGRCQSPSDTITISADTSSTDTPLLSPRSTSSDDSQLSHDSNHSDSPITPSTSIHYESDSARLSTELLSDKPSSPDSPITPPSTSIDYGEGLSTELLSDKTSSSPHHESESEFDSKTTTRPISSLSFFTQTVCSEI
jgi:hypothetical protein